ncbi:MAG TPA: hypothetical protein VL523_17685 [Terriglobia bacterium]|nr:hypothetical protein [Terriglobia bacterium]
MKIGGHGLQEHVRLLGPLFGFIAAAWALRMIVYAAGVSKASLWLHVISVTLVGALSILLAVVMIHRRRFGSYASVVASVFLLMCWEQLLIVAAIAFTALTGFNNVYSAPEFSFGETPWVHAAGHLTFGIGSGTIFGGAMGCLLLWMLRRGDPAGAK